MNPLAKFLKATRLFRKRFGTVPGVLLWLAFLKEKWLFPMTVFSVKVPGLRYPIFFRAHSSDVEVFCQIFCRDDLEYEVESPVRYIVDAGANIGLSSIFLAKKYPDALIDAVEVSTDNLALLRINTDPYPNINVIPNGLWGRNATLRISNPSAEPWAFQVEEVHESDVQGIPAIGIAELLVRRGMKEVDLLKIDIEGSETEVFGTGDTSWLSVVRCLMIELHDHFKPGCKEAVLQAIGNRNYTHQQHGEYHTFIFYSLL